MWDLTEDERIVYKILSKNLMKPISEIAPYVPFGKSKTTQLLKSMGQKGIITVEGRGRGTKIYHKIKVVVFYVAIGVAVGYSIHGK